MASDTFAKVGDIKGESVDAKHKDQIEVSSWSWGVTNSGQSAGTGGGAGKPSFQDFSFVHRIDKASPLLMLACATGQHVKEATLTCRKAGGQQDYLVIKLTDVIITSVLESDSGNAGQAESVTMTFAKVGMEYRPQKPDGSLGAAVQFTYDVTA